MEYSKGSLRVWWVMNPPHEGERYPVSSIEEAISKLDELAKRDLADPFCGSNAGGLEQLDDDGEWYEYYDEEDQDIDGIITKVEKELK